MSGLVQRVRNDEQRLIAGVIIALLLLGAAVLGTRASPRWIILLSMGGGAVVFIREPRFGLLALIAATLTVPFEISTGTEVTLNAATLLVPALFALWLLDSLRRGELRWAASPANRPMALFLAAGLVSLLLGNVLWDPAILKSGNFWLVQLAQWAIFLFAALAFWLTANMAQDEVWLKRLTWTFLYLGGGLAILRFLPGVGGWFNRLTTIAFIRAPFWALLAALAGGQLLYNKMLSAGNKRYLWLVLGAVVYYAFVLQQERTSNWVGLTVVAGALLWLRFPHMRRWVVSGTIVLLLLWNLVFPAVYEFAGGDEKWDESGGSRLVLIGRVVEVTLRNPITGLGPASYRPYANAEPLRYQRTLWFNPQVSSHNNYVDLFAHTGLVGLGLFLWFAVEVVLLGLRLGKRHREGFVGGYVNGMLAAWAGCLVIMILADWILPFVYNIGFPGFQASILIWLFVGGLVTLDAISDSQEA